MKNQPSPFPARTSFHAQIDHGKKKITGFTCNMNKHYSFKDIEDVEIHWYLTADSSEEKAIIKFSNGIEMDLHEWMRQYDENKTKSIGLIAEEVISQVKKEIFTGK